MLQSVSHCTKWLKWRSLFVPQVNSLIDGNPDKWFQFDSYKYEKNSVTDRYQEPVPYNSNIL